MTNLDLWTFSPGSDARPTWSPDGTMLAFDSQRSGTGQIWTMSATGANPKRITHTSTPAFWACWSDGARVEGR